MGNDDYVRQEIKKIVQNKEYIFPLNFAMASAWLLGNMKGINLKILDVKGKSSLSDYFILASASNTTLARAMADELLFNLKLQGLKTISTEGVEEADWILLDLGDIIIHIFLESSRDFYNLDDLWREAGTISIPDSYYFPPSDKMHSSNSKEESQKHYF
ncbi:MAG: ribosome silencing factor [Bacteriovoracaceae bacterium]|nr:ribosome silencing factor [Bacteriovoracaceae bacterium]